MSQRSPARGPASKRTRKRENTILKTLEGGGSFQQASEAAGICADSLWRWRQLDPEFKAKVEEAIEQGMRARTERILHALYYEATHHPTEETEVREVVTPKTEKVVELTSARRNRKAFNTTAALRWLARQDPQWRANAPAPQAESTDPLHQYLAGLDEVDPVPEELRGS